MKISRGFNNKLIDCILFIHAAMIRTGRKERKLVLSSVKLRSSNYKWLLIGSSLKLGIL